jgi:hypothetical protein
MGSCGSHSSASRRWPSSGSLEREPRPPSSTNSRSPGTWHQFQIARYVAPSPHRQVRGTKSTSPGTWHQVHIARYVAPSPHRQVRGTKSTSPGAGRGNSRARPIDQGRKFLPHPRCSRVPLIRLRLRVSRRPARFECADRLLEWSPLLMTDLRRTAARRRLRLLQVQVRARVLNDELAVVFERW